MKSFFLSFFAAYMIPPNLNLLTFSPTDWGMLRIKVWMRQFRFFFKHHREGGNVRCTVLSIQRGNGDGTKILGKSYISKEAKQKGKKGRIT